MIFQSHRWGYSEILFASAETILARAVGLAGGASSLHSHRDKANAFIPLRGFVEIWGKQTKLATLGPGKHPMFIAPPRMIHRMVFQTDAILLELYTAMANKTVRLDDIERFDVGKFPPVREVDSLATWLREDRQIREWLEKRARTLAV